ncbi:MAG: hypothetical protein REI12_05980 [Pedobacter sp.]|nr:hypothetical protein [Pedobacter sp.]
MLRALIASFSFSLLLLLTACGGDGGGSAATGPTSFGPTAVKSVVAKGIIQNGVVTLSRWQGGAYVDLVKTRTADDGSFNLTLTGGRPGEVLKLTLGLSPDSANPTRMLCDVEAGCNGVVFGDPVTLSSALDLSSWVTVGVDGSITVMPLTPVSTMLVALAEALGGGHLTPQALTVARSRTAALFRLSPEELLAVPGNIADAPWLDDAVNEAPAAAKISLLAAAFAQLAGGNVADVNQVIKNYAQSFVDNNGRLMEANQGVGITLATLYHAVNTSVDVFTSNAGQTWVNGWITAVKAELEDNRLTPICRTAASCEQFNSARFVSALGTEPGTLGYDLSQVIQKNGANSLEQLLANELAKMGWLASEDTVALAGVALQTLVYSGYAMANKALPIPIFPLEADNGLSAAIDAETGKLHVTGTQNGLNVDLWVGLPAAIAVMSADDKVFNFSLKGTVANARVSGVVDAVLSIDANDTDFSGFLTAYQNLLTAIFTGQEDPDLAPLKTAIAGLMKTAKATVTIQADKFRFAKGSSMLAIEGKGTVGFDLGGGLAGDEGDYAGGITLEGEVAYGTVTLPNGSTFTIDPDEGHELSFAMGVDGSFEADFAANVLTAMSGQASGTLKNMGPLVSGIRDLIATAITHGELDGDAALLALLVGLGNLSLDVDANIMLNEFDHEYVLKVRDTTVVTVTHPDRDDIALTVTLSFSGLLVSAGDAWWQLGADITNIEHPALVLSDDLGGAWRWEFNLGRLLAME